MSYHQYGGDSDQPQRISYIIKLTIALPGNHPYGAPPGYGAFGGPPPGMGAPPPGLGKDGKRTRESSHQWFFIS